MIEASEAAPRDASRSAARRRRTNAAGRFPRAKPAQASNPCAIAASPQHRAGRRRCSPRLRRRTAAATATRHRAEATPPRTPPVAFDAGELLPDKVPYASPAVRLFARELGVDLAQVKGSGRGGRITKEDVQGFVKARAAGGGAPARGAAARRRRRSTCCRGRRSTSPSSARSRPSRCRASRRSPAPNLARNWVMIPHVTQFDEADITELEAFRVAAQQGEREGRHQAHACSRS